MYRDMQPLKKAKMTNYINHKVPRRSQANPPCEKHPKQMYSPGVCSVCLCEKLSQLSNSSDSKSARLSSSWSSSSSSYVSSLSSSDASSCSSPAVIYKCRVEPECRKPIRVFTKSRSMAFVTQRGKEDEDGENGKKINGGVKGGFWSKLLPRRRGKLMHSKTMVIERVTAVH